MFVWSSRVNAIVGRVLGEVDGGADADREGDGADDQGQLDRADEGRQDPGLGRPARRHPRDELGVEPRQADDDDVEQERDEREDEDRDRQQAGAVEERAVQLPAHQRRLEARLRPAGGRGGHQ